MSAAGAAAAAVVLAGAALYGTIPAQHTFNNAVLPTPAVSRIMLGTAYAAVVLVAPLAFGLMMAAVSVLALRHRSLPRWLAILGFPLAVLQLANAVAPMAALVVWSLLVGITLALRKVLQSERAGWVRCCHRPGFRGRAVGGDHCNGERRGIRRLSARQRTNL